MPIPTHGGDFNLNWPPSRYFNIDDVVKIFKGG